MDALGEKTLVPKRATTSGTLGVGEVLADRYRVVRFIARGGMGEVYEVEDAVLDERVALKLLRPEIASTTALLEQFRREVQLARRVTHPNVCRLHDVGASGPHVFLTMQLLDGVPLSERIPVGRADAERFARDMADALTAAHEAGVIHRDFKPNNVMIVGGRAIVTDFGLAQSTLVPSDGATGAAGTPAYMAPEQVLGNTIGPAADRYAFGVVLHEMLTGKRPFAPDDKARLTSVPALDIDEPWRRVITGLLAPSPDARFPTARHAIEALERKPRALWKLIAPLVLLGLVGTGLVASRDRTRLVTIAPVVDETAIAIAGFDDRTGQTPDRGWIGAAVAEIMPLEIDGKRLRGIPSPQVATARLELRMTAFDDAALAALADKLDARFVVAGDLAVSDGNVKLDLRVFDRSTGTTHRGMHVSGSEADLVGVAHTATAHVVAKLLGEALPPQAPGIRASLPKNPRAARLYVDGLVAYRRFDLNTARERLQASITIEPEFPLAYHALSEVLAALGEEIAWKRAAEQAWERAGALTTEEKLLVEVRYRSARGEHDRAKEIYRALYQLRPDVEHMLAAAALSPFEERRAIYAQLRRTSSDPMIDAEEALSLRTHDVPAAIAAFDRAEAGARARGDKLLLARILVDAYPSHLYVGSGEQAHKKLLEARAIYEEVGDLIGVATAMNAEGDGHLQKGRLRAAIDAYQRSVDVARAVRSEGDAAGGLMSVALAQTWLGDPAAGANFEAALAIVHRIKPKRVKRVELFRAGLWALQGKLVEAEQVYRAFGAELTGLALGQLERWRRDPTAARAAFLATLEIDIQSGDRLEASRLRTQIARLDREAGKPADCEVSARAAIEDAKATHSNNLEAVARSELAACLLAQGKPEAAAEHALATKLGADDEELVHVAMRAVVDAKFSSSLAPLEAALVRAKAAGYVPLSRELERAIASHSRGRKQ